MHQLKLNLKLTLLLLTNHGSPMQLENLSKLRIVSTNSFIEKRINLKRKHSLSTLKQTNRYQPPNLVNENETVFNLSTVANHFNYFFTNISGEIEKTIRPSNKPPHDYLCSQNENSFYESPNCKEDIEDIISTIKTDKACGSNSIPTRILKDFKKELSKPFRDVIHISFSSGIDNFGVSDTIDEISVRGCLHENT